MIIVFKNTFLGAFGLGAIQLLFKILVKVDITYVDDNSMLVGLNSVWVFYIVFKLLYELKNDN